MVKIPDKKIKDDAGFYNPARQLVTAIKEYYQREHGIQVSQKDLEKEIIRIVRNHE